MCLTEVVRKDENLSGIGYKVFYKSESGFINIFRVNSTIYKKNETYTDKNTTRIFTFVGLQTGESGENYKSGFHVYVNVADAISTMITASIDAQGEVCLLKVKYEEGHTIGTESGCKGYTIVAKKITLLKRITKLEQLLYGQLDREDK